MVGGEYVNGFRDSFKEPKGPEPTTDLLGELTSSKELASLTLEILS